MTFQISSWCLQYENVDFAALSSSPYDLIITEGAPLPAPGVQPALDEFQIKALQNQGRRVVGYVNLAVTDTSRGYWDPSWTLGGDDLDPLSAAAPPWLVGQPTNAWGRIAAFWDPAWRQIVIDQAVDLVSNGYDGVFLDDVGAYYVLGAPLGEAAVRQFANAMCELIAAVEAAVKAVNPYAWVIVNGDPYLHTNVTQDAAGLAASDAFLASVDAMVLENADPAAVAYALQELADDFGLLALDSSGSPQAAIDAWASGLIPYVAPSPAYDALGAFIGSGTSGDDLMVGGAGPNELIGYGGDDWISAGSGADFIDGGSGRDTMIGGAGADRFSFGQDAVVSSAAGLFPDKDKILDFAPRKGDVVDLSAIDADPLTPGDQAFAFVSSFTGTAGEATLNLDSAWGYVVLSLDVDGDAQADLYIQLYGEAVEVFDQLLDESGPAYGWIL